MDYKKELDKLAIFQTVLLSDITKDPLHKSMEITKVYGGFLYHTKFMNKSGSIVQATSAFVPRG